MAAALLSAWRALLVEPPAPAPWAPRRPTEQQLSQAHQAQQTLPRSIYEANPTAVAAAVVLGAAIWVLLVWRWRRGSSDRSEAEGERQRVAAAAAAAAKVTSELQDRLAATEKTMAAMERELVRRTEALESAREAAARSAVQQDRTLEELQRELKRRADEAASETKEATARVAAQQDRALEDAQRELKRRIDTVEDSLRGVLTERIEAVEARTKASAQRIEAVDDGVRLIDSRIKGVNKRVETVEDEVTGLDSKMATTVADVSRGFQSIDKLQEQVGLLADNERVDKLSESWEEKYKELEEKIEQYRAIVEEEQARRAEIAASLTISIPEYQEVEPEPTPPASAATIEDFMYPFSHTPSSSFDGSVDMPPTPSPSTRSYTGHGVLPSPAMTPTPSKLKRLEMSTFSSRQKALSLMRTPSIG
ncbi:hypothetical protein BX600DRAFT_511646 [Xylariales sp. PMI_506]|nr:hypothetical protein BX600DRAFT_511646 [Xylariales sp. PMI_506]